MTAIKANDKASGLKVSNGQLPSSGAGGQTAKNRNPFKWVKQLIQFFKDARLEMRKVVWPTRQETLQATLMVLVAVVVMAILLWLIDMALFRIINFLTTNNF